MPSRYRSEIDGLRALAVMAVVAYHADIPGFSGGFVGVDVFFVISGYLITQHLCAELVKTGKISLLDFYSRRVRRLFPALVVTILVTLLIWGMFFIGDPEDTHPFIKSIRYSLFGMANLFFSKSSGGYFDRQTTSMPLLHFWSLGVEEQFYLVWPWLLLLLYFVGRMRLMLTGLVIYGLVSFALAQYLITGNRQPDAFYFMPPRAWELAVGGILVFIRPLLASGLNSFSSLIGLFLILMPVFFYSASTVFPGLTAIPPVFGTALLIFTTDSKTNPVRNFFGSKLAVKIGVLSYGWYLWHWPLLALARVQYMGSLPPIELRLMLSWASLKWVETPVRSGKLFKNLSPKQVLLRAASFSLFVLLMGAVVVEFENRYVNRFDHGFAKKVADRTSIYSTCVDHPENALSGKCMVRYSKEAPEKSKKIIVWGDSHSFAYFPMIDQFAKLNEVDSALYEFSGHLPIIHSEAWFDDESRTRSVNQFNHGVLEQIKKIIDESSPELVSVVIAGRWMQRSGKQPISIDEGPKYLTKELNETKNLSVLEKGLEGVFADLSKVGVKRILLMMPYPEFKYMALKCHLRKLKTCDTPRSEMERYRAEVMNVLFRTVARYKNVRVVDPVRYLCDQENCPQVLMVNGEPIPVTFDDDHPSVAASQFLGAQIEPELKWLIGATQ